jgi:glycosyltransferase involved in cell wall biosynthesis
MRYVVDVTQLIHWQGNLTGIPRVMDELAIRFAKYNASNSVFVSWVKELGAMCEVDFIATRQHRSNGIAYLRQNNTGSAPKAPEAKAYLKRGIKKIAHKSGLSTSRLYTKMATANVALEAKSYKVYTPEAGDKLFIPWGEWWDQNWLSLVARYKASNVAIYPICHDILPMLVPQFSGNSSSLLHFVEQIFPLASVVITPSRATKKDLTAWMKDKKLQVPKIEVFRLGEDFTITNPVISDGDMRAKYNVIKDDYLIFVSTIEPRKNHTLLYYTYKLALSRNVQLPKLLIVGREGHDTKEITKFIKEDPGTNNLLKICDYVPDNELNWLYNNCKFTVVPSFYEGWGMTVLESIARGKPAICSNTSSLLEMPDDCVIRFNPASTDECLNAIITMSKPMNIKKYRSAAQKYKPHSWDGSYNQIIQILEDK